MLEAPYPELDDLLERMGVAGTAPASRSHRIVIWAEHGVMSRSDVSVKRATDRIEYAETAAKHQYLNLSVGKIGEGLSPEEIRSIGETFNVRQTIFWRRL